MCGLVWRMHNATDKRSDALGSIWVAKPCMGPDMQLVLFEEAYQWLPLQPESLGAGVVATHDWTACVLLGKWCCSFSGAC